MANEKVKLHCSETFRFAKLYAGNPALVQLKI